MNERICTFFGHRDAPQEAREALRREIAQLIEEEHVYTYYVGGYGGFDRMAAGVLSELRAQYPALRVCLILAYLRPPREELSLFDEIIFPDGQESAPPRFAISRRNRWMVARADYVIGYVTRSSGGAYAALRQARRAGKSIRNLADTHGVSPSGR